MTDQTSPERKVIVKGLDPETLREALGSVGISDFEIVEPDDNRADIAANHDRSNEAVAQDTYVTVKQLKDFMRQHRIYAGQFEISLRYFQKQSRRYLSADQKKKVKSSWQTPPTPEEYQEFEAELESLRQQGVDVYKGRSDSSYYAYYFDTSSGPIQTLRFDPESGLQLNMSGLNRLSEEAQDPRRLDVYADSFVKSATGQLFMGAANVMVRESSTKVA